MPDTTNAEREQRYADAIAARTSYADPEFVSNLARAVLAVADAELAELRADNARGRVNLEHYRQTMDEFGGRVAAAEVKVARVEGALAHAGTVMGVPMIDVATVRRAIDGDS